MKNMPVIIILHLVQMIKVFDQVRFLEMCEKFRSRGVVDPHYLVDQFSFIHSTAHT